MVLRLDSFPGGTTFQAEDLLGILPTATSPFTIHFSRFVFVSAADVVLFQLQVRVHAELPEIHYLGQHRVWLAVVGNVSELETRVALEGELTQINAVSLEQRRPLKRSRPGTLCAVEAGSFSAESRPAQAERVGDPGPFQRSRAP